MKLLAIDGNSILNRAYYGIRPLSTKDGIYTNGIYGFLTILLRMQQEVQPEAVAVAFDMRAPTFRHKKYDGYKAQRKGMPDELAMQMPYLKELLYTLGYACIECEGWEADDILGTLAKASQENNSECVIATGDRDSFQLIGDGVTVRLASTKQGRPHTEIFDHTAILEKYGVAPRELIDVKALMGDSSDNIPGVAGVGEKTALALISEFSSLDGVYENIDAKSIKDGARKKLIAGRDMAYLSYELAEIDCNAPIDKVTDTYMKKAVDNREAYRIMTKLELFSLMERFGVRPESLTENTAVEKAANTIEIRFNTLPENLLTGKEPVNVLFKLSGTEIMALCVVADAIYYCDENCSQIAQNILSSSVAKRTNHLKTLYHHSFAGNYDVQNVIFDLEIAAYILNPTANDYSYARLCSEYGVQVPDDTGFHGEYPELLAEAAVFAALAEKLTLKLELNEQTKLMTEIELPLARVLANMEQAGIMLDTEGLTAFGHKLEGELAQVQTQVYKHAGEEFNINSPKQLGVILFEKLALPTGKKTKTGWSTNVDVLEGLRDKHPIVGEVLEFRKLAKLKSTYVDGFLALVGDDGRIHTTLQQTLTRTGRISSVEPNMQNIPVRTPLGSELRRFFTAPQGTTLLDADYSQIELRVLAHISGDEAMIEAFRNDEDIHTKTAGQVFDLPPMFITPLMRSRAKAVNFGIVYGIGAYSLSQDIGVTVAEADKYIKGYLSAYSGVKQYMQDIVDFGTENGYVKTLFERRRYLPELASKNRALHEFGKRVALNTPIQGTAADIIKIAMVRVFERLQREGLKSRLILQVHDELIVESPADEIEHASRILGEEMEQAVKLNAPLSAHVNTGHNWLEAK